MRLNICDVEGDITPHAAHTTCHTDAQCIGWFLQNNTSETLKTRSICERMDFNFYPDICTVRITHGIITFTTVIIFSLWWLCYHEWGQWFGMGVAYNTSGVHCTLSSQTLRSQNLRFRWKTAEEEEILWRRHKIKQICNQHIFSQRNSTVYTDA